MKFRVVVVILLALAGSALAGCKQAEPAPSAEIELLDPFGEAALPGDAELDDTARLALGILSLEGSENAVTPEQAVTLLPLWTALQEGVAQTTAERGAVLGQIEGALTASQLSAIRALELTQEDGLAWLRERGDSFAPGGSMPGAGAGGGIAPGGRQGGMGTPPEGAGPPDFDRAAMQERFESMTEEERAQMRESFAQQAPAAEAQTGGFSSGLSSLLERAVISLLSERSGQATVPELEADGPSPGGSEPASEPPSAVVEVQLTPEPTRTAIPKPQAESTPEPESRLEPEEVAAEVTIQPAASESPSFTAAAEPAASSSSATVLASPALAQVPDTDPGPPLTVEVTTNYAESNPNYAGGLIYHVAGFLHNPTDAFYAVTAVNVTFYDASGFRGAYYPFPMRRYGEYIWHGALQAEVGCSMVGPGESCPFSVEIGAQDMASFLVHPDAEIAEWHVSASVTVGDVKVSDTGTSYVKISGTVANPNPYPVKNVSIAGVLLDAAGQMVSTGKGVVPAIAAEGSASFEVYIAREAYASYALYPTAEQDAK